jgi:hypothetical protein
MLRLTASSPAELKVLERREDGSGVVEAPVLSIGTLDLGGQSLEITAATIDELVANFNQYPGPVPIGVSPHVEFEERSGPQPGFVDRLYLRDGQLWARMDLSAWLFASVTKDRAWRGFSVEMIRNLSHPSRKFEGWVLVGGVFTNRPASDVVFKVAAEADEAVGIYSRLQADASAQEDTMEDVKTVSLATHEAKLAEVRAEATEQKERAVAFEGQVTAIKADLKSATEKVANLETQLATVQSEKIVAASRATTLEAQVKRMQSEKGALETRLTEAEASLKSQTEKETGSEVKRVILEAIDAGVAGALFDGYAADPVAWLNANYASLDAFKAAVDRIRTVGPRVNLNAKPEKSGAAEARKVADRADVELTPEEVETLKGAGVKLDVSFAGVTTEAEARKRFEAFKQAAK